MTPVLLSHALQVQKNDLLVSHVDVDIDAEMYMSLTRCYSLQETVLLKEFHPQQRHAVLHFIVNGQTTFSQGNHVSAATITGDKCNLMLMQPNYTQQVISLKGDLTMASIYIPLHRFLLLLENSIESMPEKFKKAIHKNVCSCNHFHWTPKAYYIIHQLLTNQPDKATLALYHENILLELLTLLLEAENCEYYNSITISAADKRKIYMVKDLLMTDISRNFSLEFLAKAVGTNEFTLKKGFKEIYGKPVYQFIIQKRMEKAIRLLSTTRLPVMEIAMVTGYEDASAFTRTFKKIFGHLPIEFRKSIS